MAKELDVWVLIPTAMKEHVPAQLEKWRGRGYKLGILTDGNMSAQWVTIPRPDLWIYHVEYPGVWASWNILAHTARRLGADVCVLAGDDMDPDPTKTAQEIAAEYLEKFPDGFGVMQPCGDPQGKDAEGKVAAERICGSPWVGKAWIQFAYGGGGPVNEMYHAFYADEELKHYAEKMGRLWMRPDLSQFHRHWSWRHLPKQDYHERNQAVWDADRALFESRRKTGFA